MQLTRLTFAVGPEYVRQVEGTVVLRGEESVVIATKRGELEVPKADIIREESIGKKT